jgi:WD40 repeat protein
MDNAMDTLKKAGSRKKVPFANGSVAKGKSMRTALASTVGKMSSRAGQSSRGGSRRSKKKGKDLGARIIDQLGRDVTPKSMNPSGQKAVTGGDLDASSLQLLQDSRKGKSGNLSDSNSDSGSVSDSVDFGSVTLARPRMAAKEDSAPAETEQPAEEAKTVRKLTEKELQQQIHVKITETETFTLLHIPGIRIWGEDEKLHELITEKNARYVAMETKQREEKDKFSMRHAQTFNNSLRDKEIQASPPETKEEGVQVTTWGIYDAYNEDQPTETAAAAGLMGANGAVAAAAANSVQGSSTSKASVKGSMASMASMGSMASMASMNMASASAMTQNSLRSGASSGAGGDQPHSITGSTHGIVPNSFEAVSRMPEFMRALAVMEQAVIQNEIREKQLLYRAKAPVVDADSQEMKPVERAPEEEVEKPKLVPLWSYGCEAVADLPVSCMCFNKQNLDLLVAGYGRSEFGNSDRGHILFWSLKNPTHPTKRINTKHSVTSIDFCTEHPHLLAVGLYDGSVAIYDIRDTTDKPALMSQHATGKHSEPVWGVKWVAKEAATKTQTLYSISTDGTVLQWSTKKGLVPHELMQLKRIPNRAHFQGSAMEGMSREASGLCFDFPINDGTQYFAGTEDGLLHKCSVSYNEQTLENYYGHTGPVYKVRASPFLADAFLSCSADWTAALWSQSSSSPAMVFQSGHDYVMDVQWAPSNSCVFGSVSRDGRVEVWDLESSPLDPIIKHEVATTMTTVLFSPNSPVILTGANNGVIEVYRMSGVSEFSDMTPEMQAARLVEAMDAHNHTDNSKHAQDDVKEKEGSSAE